MKNLITMVIAALALLANPTFAQPGMDDIPSSRKEEIRAQKAAFLTQRLALTPDEAQQFWPLYNAFENELDANRNNKREQRKAIGAKKDEMTEEQAMKMIDLEMAFKQNELDIRRKHNGHFINSIGAVRTANLYHSERDFHKELLKRFRERGPRGEGERKRP